MRASPRCALLTRSLYRALLRHARVFDLFPILRFALIRDDTIHTRGHSLDKELTSAWDYVERFLGSRKYYIGDIVKRNSNSHDNDDSDDYLSSSGNDISSRRSATQFVADAFRRRSNHWKTDTDVGELLYDGFAVLRWLRTMLASEEVRSLLETDNYETANTVVDVLSGRRTRCKRSIKVKKKDDDELQRRRLVLRALYTPPLLHGNQLVSSSKYHKLDETFRLSKLLKSDKLGVNNNTDQGRNPFFLIAHPFLRAESKHDMIGNSGYELSQSFLSSKNIQLYKRSIIMICGESHTGNTVHGLVLNKKSSRRIRNSPYYSITPSRGRDNGRSIDDNERSHLFPFRNHLLHRGGHLPCLQLLHGSDIVGGLLVDETSNSRCYMGGDLRKLKLSANNIGFHSVDNKHIESENHDIADVPLKSHAEEIEQVDDFFFFNGEFEADVVEVEEQILDGKWIIIRGLDLDCVNLMKRYKKSEYKIMKSPTENVNDLSEKSSNKMWIAFMLSLGGEFENLIARSATRICWE